MGIASIVVAALKRVPWTSLAMNYGPELMKKFKNAPSEATEEDAAQVFEEVAKRIQELETLVTDQEKVIREQQERIEQLAASCRELEGKAGMFRMIAALAAVAAAGAVVALFVR